MAARARSISAFNPEVAAKIRPRGAKMGYVEHTGHGGAARLWLLAALGLYGVTAYTVVRRTPEIGIRMALGAERSRVIAMVMRGTMLQALLGLLIGAPVAMFCVRYVRSQLYGIISVNFTVMVAAAATLAVSAAIAGIIPARRAASINPVEALRVG